MTVYVALLRGINLGGHNRVSMPDLRNLFTTLGHDGVRSYIQSGNLIFNSTVDDPARLAAEIERGVARDLGVSVTVLVRTSDELTRVVANNPFTGRDVDASTLHVTFLADEPDPDRATELRAPAGMPDEFVLASREVYLHCPEGYGRTRLNNTFFEKRLATAATTRNWKVVNTLLDLTGVHGEGPP